MNAHFFTYSIEFSVYLLFFLVVYRFTISKLTHFSWMRGYLLSSLILSTVLPFVKIPTYWAQSIIGQSIDNVSFQINVLNPYLMTTTKTAESAQMAPYSNPWMFILIGLSIIYILGAIYKSVLLFGNINKILTIIKKNVKNKEGAYFLLDTDIELPAFSFFNFIFINRDYKNLTNDDILRIKKHEIIHAKQWHTLDILFVELISVIFWFNPLVHYTKNKLQEIHEFIADEETAGQGEMKKNYAQLLFNLATEKKSFHLMTGFSSKQISNRILMVSKRRSIRWSKLLFVTLFPVAFALLMSFSIIDSTTINTNNNININQSGSLNSAKVGNIKWVNNTIFNSIELDKALGLKKGDEYDLDKAKSKLNIYTDRVTTLYNDKGYLYAKVDISESKSIEGIIDLTLTIHEGKQGKIGLVKVEGNKSVSTDEILSKISIKAGDLFSKTKIIESIKALSMMKKLDPEKLRPLIAPQKSDPQSEIVIVNLVFVVSEK